MASKNVFIITVLVVFIGVAGWFFLQKTEASKESTSLDSAGLNGSPTPTATVTSTPTQGQWVEVAGGLKIQDVVIGPGTEARAGNAIAAHYEGRLNDENGTMFDSSRERGQPFAFILGSGQVIQGWDVGIQGMKVGGKRKLIIPPALAYGNRVMGNGLIPANSTLYFEVELLEVQEIRPR